MLCPPILLQQLLVLEGVLACPDERPSLDMAPISQVHPSDFRTSGKGKKQPKGGATPGTVKCTKRAGLSLSGSLGLSWTGEQTGAELCIWPCSSFEEPEEAADFVSARQTRYSSLQERKFQQGNRKARVEEGSAPPAEAPTTPE